MPEMPPGFELDSGLREDMVLSIHSSYFAPNADYMDGRILLLYLIGTDESENPVEIRMSLGGADWQTDDGTTVSNPARKKQHIMKTSIYGWWLAYAFEVPELAKVLVERANSLGEYGSRDSRIWLDLILQLENRTLHWGGNIADQDKLMPVGFLGLTTDNQQQELVSQPSTQPAIVDPLAVVQAARAQAAVPVAANGTLYEKAIAMAKGAPDYATFLSTALSDPEILADDELAVACADQNQIWAAAH